MQISRGTFIAFMMFAPGMIHGQPGAPAPATPTNETAPLTPSSVLQPALSTMESTLTSLKIDKWKKGSIREECGDNVNDILKDLKTNLPPLMQDADSAPGALSKSIPLMKHVDALYDVLLRVEEGARVSAPGDQVNQLESALKQFGIARIQLYDNMAQQAAAHEKHVTDLQATLKAQQAAAEEHKAAPAAASVPCTPPKPAAKRRHVTRKPAAAAGSPPAASAPAQKPPAQTKPQ
jgi:hypothetical protein